MPKQLSEIHEETLVGDVRDMLLTHIRSMETPWSKLPERDQADKIEACESAATFLVSQVCALMAKQDFPNLLVQVGKFSVDKGVKIEALASSTVENINKLAEHGKGAAILVLVDPQEYFGEVAEVAADPDEPELPMEGDTDAEDQAEDREASAGTNATAPAPDVSELPGAGPLPEHLVRTQDAA